jgi:hypothetical protein
MEVRDGDRLVVEYNAETNVATVRKRPTSYAGILTGVYGDKAEDVIDYVDAERESWAADD